MDSKSQSLPGAFFGGATRARNHAHRFGRLIVACIIVQIIIFIYHLTGPPKSLSRSLGLNTEPDFSHLADHCAHVSPIRANSFVRRQQALAETLHSLNASAYIAEPGASASYFANLSEAQWFLSERPLLLIISPEVDAEDQVKARVSILTPAFEATRAKLLSIPSASDISFPAWSFVADGLQKASPESKVTLAPVEIRQLRERKIEEELKIMKCVNEVTVLAIRAVRENIYIGMRVFDARQLIVKVLSAAGLQNPSAFTLFGENAALPHGTGTDRVLGAHDFALIDCDGSLHGYHSDVTRIFALPGSTIHAAYLRLWHLVHSAQANALNAARNGTTTAETLAAQGYAEYLTHRLGHGIGLDTGIRLEDCFYVAEDGSAVLLTAGVGGAATSPSPWDL
ncbi:Creatinase/aminopeptidase [Laetiporus sulphureus 93-53]|uniref:Creatinase/aminopeptidase n=1 Tax=Laetiporus sulphureus 93-53 TaxID=1314785 RepID=A0A165C3Z4_9APHY|nr:Creatinase/aminopeptidase [Laetiporus sulphureus 93-53]KZT02164.1 Creatinase/aminopeptidase [Laetiporus sulphureus 93-53]